MSLTRPEAEQVLGAAGFDGAHGAVLDTHYGPFGAERHRRRCVGVEGEFVNGGSACVSDDEVPGASMELPSRGSCRRCYSADRYMDRRW